MPPADSAAIEKLREELRVVEDRLSGAVSRAAKQAAERAKETVDARLKGDRLLQDLADKVAEQAQDKLADKLADKLETQLLARLPERVLEQVGPDLDQRIAALSVTLPADARAAVEERLKQEELAGLAKRLDEIPAEAKQTAADAVAALDVDVLAERVSKPAADQAIEYVQDRLKGDLGKQLIGHLSGKVEEDARAKALAALKDDPAALLEALLPKLTEHLTTWLSEREPTLADAVGERVGKRTEQLVDERMSAFDLEGLPDLTAERVQKAFLSQMETEGLAALPVLNQELRTAIDGVRAEVAELRTSTPAEGGGGANDSVSAPGLDRDAVEALIAERVASLPAPSSAPAGAGPAELDEVELEVVADRAAQTALQSLEDRFATQQERLQEMLDDALAPALSARASQEALKLLESRLYKTEKMLAEMEQRVGQASDSAAIEEENEEVARLRERVAALEQQLQSTPEPGPDPEVVNELQSRLDQVEHEHHQSSGRLATLEEEIATGSDQGEVETDLLTDMKYRLAVVEQRVGEVDNPTLRAEVNHTDKKVTLVTDRMSDLERRVTNLKENLDLKNLAERVAIHAIGPVMEAIDGRLAEIDIRRLPDKIADHVEERATGRILRRIREQLRSGALDALEQAASDGDLDEASSAEVSGDEPREGYLDDDFAKFRSRRLGNSKQFRDALEAEVSDDPASAAAEEAEAAEDEAALAEALAAGEGSVAPMGEVADEDDEIPAELTESEERELSPAEREAIDAVQALRRITRREPPE